jgi:diguanylate cyclase (GGDEF)-like protein/PAS domain S-box-containing protein
MRVNSLKTKMAVAVSLLVISLGLLLSYFTFTYFERLFKEAIADQEYTLIDTMADEIDNKFDIVHTALIVTGSKVTPDIVADPDKAQAFLDAQTALRAIFDNRIYLFSATGRIIAESPFDFGRRGLDFSYRDYFRQTVATQKPFISEPYISTQVHRHPAIMLTAPVLDDDGKLIAILAGSFDLLKDNFLGTLSRTRIGDSGYVYIYNTERTIILHPELGRVLKQDVPAGVISAFDEAIQGFEGSAETVNLRGVRCLSTFKHLKSTNWIMAANHPVDEVYAPITEARQYFMLATLLGLAMLLLVIWLVVGYLLKPLAIFTRHVETLGEKKGGDRFSSGMPDDEIGALATAFNNMLGELDAKQTSLEKSEELYRTVTDFASDMVFWRSPEGTILYISPNCERLTGYEDREFYAAPGLLDEIVHVEDRPLWLAYANRERTAASSTLEFRIVTKMGGIAWISCSSRYVYSEKGEFCGLRGSHQDISDRKQAETQLQYMSMHDSLTGFRNRASFEQEMVTFGAGGVQPVAVILCDVDGLKFVNDTLGHNAGDELLIRVADILRRCLPPGTLMYRVGGDEFTAVLISTGQAAAMRVCEEFRQAIAIYNAGEVELPISVSVGLATSENRSADIRALIKEADDAMYREKLGHSQNSRGVALASMLKALDTRDFCSGGHADRLREMAVALAKKVGLPAKAFDNLLLLAQFHDIGKIGIPDMILFKRGLLTKREREIIERHAEIGYRMAVATPELAPVAEYILKHHERWDGQGYPLRLKGEAIPLECRILAIVDAYDAMVNDRPYRKAMDQAAALTEIVRGAGSQFDPQLAAIFVASFAEDGE